MQFELNELTSELNNLYEPDVMMTEQFGMADIS